MATNHFSESNEALPIPHSEDIHSPRENLFQAPPRTSSQAQQGATVTHARTLSSSLSSVSTSMTNEEQTAVSTNGHIGQKKPLPPHESDVFIIGIAGGSASGKTSVSKRIIQNLNVPQVILISMDSFYKVLTPEQSAKAAQNDYNFDHPGSPFYFASCPRFPLSFSLSLARPFAFDTLL